MLENDSWLSILQLGDGVIDEHAQVQIRGKCVFMKEGRNNYLVMH